MIMKNLLALLLVSAFAMAPVAAAEEKKPETKKICVDLQGKDGKAVIDPKTKKPKQDCKEVKVHKKHEGTKPEDVKKK
jgi:azurin